MDVFLALSCHLTDEAKLDRMIPYIVDLLHDESAYVRAASLRTLVQVVGGRLLWLANVLLTHETAYACNSHYAFECCHISRIYHS